MWVLVLIMPFSHTQITTYTKTEQYRITTGRSTAERELEENLASSLKELLVERRGNRLGVSEIRRQLGEILNTQVQPEDLTDILKVMDADGLVQFNVSRECSLLFLCSCDCTAQELTHITS